jgi:hypothetical protein
MKGRFSAPWLVAAALLTSATAQDPGDGNPEPLRIEEQGSFATGGTVTVNAGTFNAKRPAPGGQTLHGDHAYVFFQIRVNRRKLPLVFLHGAGQFSKTWETTPGGREGFQTIFLRRRFPVNVIDQPRRGNAGRSTLSATISATPDEQQWFNTFRVGIWPEYDFIPKEPLDPPGQDGWRVRLEMARKWRDTVNRHGGDATFVHLPEAGVRGNTYIPFSELNNQKVAGLMAQFLSEKKLD